MELGINATAFSGTALYCIASIAALIYLCYGHGQKFALSLNAAVLCTLAGACCFMLTLLLRWAMWQRLPLTSPADTLLLMTVLCALLSLPLLLKKDLRTLVCFYTPPLAALVLFAFLSARHSLHEAPRELSSSFLLTHVGLAFLAYALFFLASMTGLSYMVQVRRLKHHQSSARFNKLPSLEKLDDTLYRMIRLGYFLFAITLLLGLGWAHADRALLGQYWYVAPKVLLSFVMAAFFSAAFHGRRTGLLRGPKLAHFVFYGFSVLLIVHIMLLLLNLRAHNFWETVA
jgi:ABC-type uncharacterized transport system permease subunit